ncbi:MAG TPA: hypothetical protein VJB93_00225, partial [Patescibacteria group bacterium]|nr:hypothetical protein [Patescibacteria group bacterium]
MSEKQSTVASAAADARAQQSWEQEVAAQKQRDAEMAAIDENSTSVPPENRSTLLSAVTIEANPSLTREEMINQRELLNNAKISQIKESNVFDADKKQMLERAGQYAQGNGMERIKGNQEFQTKVAGALEKYIKIGTPDAVSDTELAPLAQEVGMSVKDFRSQLESISQELLHQAEKAVAVEDIQAQGPRPDTFWGKVGDISKKALKGIGITSGYAAGSVGVSLAVTKGVALIGLGALGALPASIIVGGGFLAMRIIKSRKKSQETQKKIEQKQKELRTAFQSTPEVMQKLNALIVSKNQEQVDTALEEIVETEIHVGTRENARNLRTATATETEDRRKELHAKKKKTLKNKIMTYLVEGQGMEQKKAEIIANNAMGLQVLDERSQEIEKDLDPLWARFGKKLEQVADFDVKNKSDKHLMRMGLARIGIGIGITLFGDRDMGSRIIGAAFSGLGGRSIGEVAFRTAQRKMARPELTAQRFDEVMASNATNEEKQKLYFEARALFADTKKREALEKSDPTRYAELKIRVEKETIRQFQIILSQVQEKNDSLGRHVESGVQIAAVKNKIDEITSGTRATKRAEQKRETQEQATRAATQLAIGAAVSAATWYLTPVVRQFLREQLTDAARFVIEHSDSAQAAGGATIAVPSIEGGRNIRPQSSHPTLREGYVPDNPIVTGRLDHVHETTRFDHAGQVADTGGDDPLSPTEATPAEATPAEVTPAEVTPAEVTVSDIQYEGQVGHYDSAHEYFNVREKIVAITGTGDQRELEKLTDSLSWFKPSGNNPTHKIEKDGYTVWLAYDGTKKLYTLVGEKVQGDVWKHHNVQSQDGAVLIDGKLITPTVIEVPIEPATPLPPSETSPLSDAPPSSEATEPTVSETSPATSTEAVSVFNGIDKNNYWSVDVGKVIAEFKIEGILKQQVVQEVKYERAYIDNLISEMARYKQEYSTRPQWATFEQAVTNDKKYLERSRSRLNDLISHAVAGEVDKIKPEEFAKITGNIEKVGQDTARMTLKALAMQVKLTTRQESMADAFAELDTNESSASSAPPSLGGSAPPEEPELSDLPSNPDSIEGQGNIERITFHGGHVQFMQGRNEGELSVSVEIKLVGFRPSDYYGKDINGIDPSKITELQHTLRVMKSYTEGYRQYSAQHDDVVDNAHKKAFFDAIKWHAKDYNQGGKEVINLDKFLADMEMPLDTSAPPKPPPVEPPPPGDPDGHVIDTPTAGGSGETVLTIPEIKLSSQEKQELDTFIHGLDAKIGNLVNQKEFMGSAMAQELDTIVEKKSLPIQKAGDDYIFDLKGQKYQVVESPWYHDQYPAGVPPMKSDLIFMKKGAENQEFFAVPYDRIVSEMQNAQAQAEPLSGRVEKFIAEMAQQAHENFVEQERMAPKLQGFDLPKDKPIGFLSIVPDQPELKEDPITGGMVDQSKHMPLLLKQRGYPVQMPEATDGGLVHSGRDAFATIHNTVESLHAKGTRDFYLDLVGHGNKDGIYFGKTAAAPHIDTQNLLQLVRQ